MNWRVAALRNGFQDMAAYRVEFFLEIVGSAILPAAVQLVLWYAMFKVGGADTIAGMTFGMMINYTLASTLFTQIRGGNHDFDLAEMVRDGTLSSYLLRPVGVVEFVYLRGVSPKIVTVAVALLAGFAFGLSFDLHLSRLLGAMLLAFLGNIIHYQLSAALASLAFYWEEAYSILMVKNMLVSLLSGELLPLTLFPASAAWVWKVLPFHLYVFTPTQYALGQIGHVEFAQAFLQAGLWLAVGTALVRLSWRVGIRRYVSLGG